MTHPTPASRVLYAGDTTLTTAAGYLAGVMTHCGIAFDYVPSDQPIASQGVGEAYALYILSDYPVNRLGEAGSAAIAAAVEGGAGLLMIGGWESFHGLAGQYNGTLLADVLPVAMLDSDDRVNSAHPCVIEPIADHAIIRDLPWDHPPTIGGYNRIEPKPGATELLRVRHLDVKRLSDGQYRFSTEHAAPLLVVGTHGAGRTAALATDVAPHWVGGFVDWGAPRVRAQADGGEAVEVGCHYAEFFARLVRWAMGQL